MLSWLAAAVVGLSVGLLGGGGSILAVPALVFVVGRPEKVAIAEAMAIVGAVSLITAAPYAWNRLVRWRAVLLFGAPTVAGTYLGAWLAKWVPGAVQLILFALTLAGVGILMLRPPRALRGPARRRHPLWLLAPEGLAVGIFTGVVGVGGGFLIVPVLVLLGGLSMLKAVATSVAIIAGKSAAGLVKYIEILDEGGHSVDWQLIGLFVAVGTASSLAGQYVARRLNPKRLRQLFAWLVLVVAAAILVHYLQRYLVRGAA